MLTGKQWSERMASRESCVTFIRELRDRQNNLREELRPYEKGTMRIARGPAGGPMQDITDQRIMTIRGEIASLQRVIDHVIAEQGISDA
jgi:hypothetical protein